MESSEAQPMMRLLLTGASGLLGAYLLRELAQWQGDGVAWSGTQGGDLFGRRLLPVDLADTDQVVAAFRQSKPTVVLHAAALASVAECQRDPQRARQVNVQATALLAELAAEGRARLVFVSTDLVFDGEHAPYRETDSAAPLSLYGATKAEAESAVLA